MIEVPRITKGWTYRVYSQGWDEPLVSEGVLLGYTALGDGTALAIDMEVEGKQVLRYIPADAILVVELMAAGESSEMAEDSTVYFG